jgi:hypothetical protein
MDPFRRYRSWPLRALAPLLAGSALTGCMHYRSDYVAPADGRARAVWSAGGIVMKGATPTPVCRAEILAATGGLKEPSGWTDGSSSPSSSLNLRMRLDRVPVIRLRDAPGVGSLRRLALPSARSSGGHFNLGGRGFGGHGGFSFGGGHGGGKEMVIIVVVVVMVVLPIVAISMAVSDPEPEEASADTIDQVNAYNDMAALEGSPCAPAELP